MEHNNDREDNKSKSKKPNRRPRDKRSTCRHFLEGRCTYGRENCNFPHRDGELRPEMVAAAAQQEEEVALAEARYNANAHAHALYSSSVTYNSGLYVNGHYVNHGHYTNNGRVNNSHHQHQPALPPPPPQWMGYRIANPMPNALGRPTFDGTQEEATSYFDSPLPPYAGPSSHAGPSRPPPGYGPPEYGAPVPYYAPPHHLVHGRHGNGYAGPSFPPPGLPLPLPGPPLDPMGMSWRPTHQPRPLGPPPGFGPDPSNALARPPGFEPGSGPGAYPLSPSPAPPNPHHGLELASAAVAASPAPEEAPVPNTAPAATVAGPAQDPSTIRCWYGLGCKRPGCHFRHDGGRDGHVVNGEASGSGSGSGSANANGDGDDVSMSESSGSMYVPPPPASEQFHAAATPQSSPRQLPDSVAGDVTPPSVGGDVTSSSAAGDVTPPSPVHTSEEYSAEEGEGDAEQPAAEEETPEAEHPEEEKKEEKKEEEEKQVPAPADAVQQPAARRPGPAVVDGRSAWGLGLVKANGTQEAA
ncbi:uncharacterized protein CCOS01_08573 [Colletotrichum costaricense]|uniref:C3H1-type domain-containing protein n=1 Tax=Colletotrichum costaricense TaxID=1209916 RepID=A0AAI9YWR3_9PEZI|nr:uncharacterized protein CCOS01_08573 [Colletotrichum costaricense]KAK1526155.1 hypothetical protein CCOS01_08573 [Colletotrichum costaricense]